MFMFMFISIFISISISLFYASVDFNLFILRFLYTEGDSRIKVRTSFPASPLRASRVTCPVRSLSGPREDAESCAAAGTAADSTVAEAAWSDGPLYAV